MSIVVSPNVIHLSRGAAHDSCGISFEEEFEKRNTRAERRTQDVNNINEDNVLRSETIDEDGVAAIEELTKIMKETGNDIKETAAKVTKKLREIEKYVKDTTGLGREDKEKIYGSIIVAKDNWPLLMSGNYRDKLRGGLAVMSSVAQYAAVLGPGGVAFAAVFPQICSFLSGFLKVAEAEKVVPETHEEMFKRVIEAAFNEEMVKDLKGESEAVSSALVDNTNFLGDCLDNIKQASSEPATVTRIVLMIETGDNFLNYFAARLKQQNRNDRVNNHGFYVPSRIAINHANLCGTFANLMLYRMQFLLKMKTVVNFPDFNIKTNSKSIDRELEDLKQLYDGVFGFMHDKFLPQEKDSASFARLYLQDQTTINVIEALGSVLGRNNRGWGVSTFFNRERKKYMEAVGGRPTGNIICDPSHWHNYDHVQSSHSGAEGFKFLVFVVSKSTFMIFSLKLAGFVSVVGSNTLVLPNSFNPNSTNLFERDVSGFSGYVKFSRSGKNIVSQKWKDILDFKSSTGHDSDWLRDNIHTPPTLFNVKNVKLNLNLQAHVGWTHLGLHKDNNWMALKFELAKMHSDDLTNLYTIRNYDSGWFITTRADSATLSMKMKLNYPYGVWQVEEHLWKGEKVFTIMSLAKKDDDESYKYLNRRGHTPCVTPRGELEPSTDENFLWKLVNPSLASVARGIVAEPASWKCW